MNEPHPSLDDQMKEALWRQRDHVIASHHVDRRGWTRDRWVDDARRLHGDLDGSVLDLVNGHIMAMLDEIDALNGRWLKRGGLPNWKHIAVKLASAGADFIRLSTAEADALRGALGDANAIEADTRCERTADAATYHQEEL